MKLRVGDSIVVLTGDQGYMAFDTTTETLVRLNETAALAIELADGSRSESEILSAVVSLIGHDKAEKCRKWIAKAIEKGLLADADTLPASPPLDAEALSNLATKIRWNDQVHTAWLLQKHAAELAPDDPIQAYRLAELAHILDRRDEARAAYEQYFRHHPDDAEIAHILTALRDDAPPGRASDACIQQIYDRFASFYEDNMCGDLDYRAPDHLFAAVRQAFLGRNDLVAADLGCGTGLFGQKLRPISQRLIGMDLSPAMLEKARERAVYDDLDCAEITAWLAREPVDRFDLIAICDTLIYFGDLRQVLPACVKHLKPGGHIAFTLEKADSAPFLLGDSGRYRHHRNHIREVAAEAGLKLVHKSDKVLRREYGTDVIGLVTVLQKEFD